MRNVLCNDSRSMFRSISNLPLRQQRYEEFLKMHEAALF